MTPRFRPSSLSSPSGPGPSQKFAAAKKVRPSSPERDDGLHRDLAEMLDSHVVNIERANAALKTGG